VKLQISMLIIIIGQHWGNTGLSTCWRTYYTEFYNFSTPNHLEQLVHKYAHIAGNILDLICTDLSYKVQSTNRITLGISDRFMIETVLTGKVEQKKKPFIPPPPPHQAISQNRTRRVYNWFRRAALYY